MKLEVTEQVEDKCFCKDLLLVQAPLANQIDTQLQVSVPARARLTIIGVAWPIGSKERELDHT